MAQQPPVSQGLLIIEASRSQTHTHTLGRTPVEWSARRRDFYLENTQHSQETDIHACGKIQPPQSQQATGGRPKP
jgi:hypothetical protein